MIRFAYEETIRADPHAVFAIMTDISQFDRWLDMDGRAKDPGPPGVGSRFDSTSRLGPLRVEGQGEVTSFEPDRRFGFRLVSPHALDFEIEIELQAADGGTVMRASGSMATHRLWRLLEPVLRMELQEGEAREARRLKAIVESSPAAVAAS